MIADASRVGLLLVLAALLLITAFQLPGDVFLDFGPNDVRYTSGFREDFEVDEPTIIHWAGDRASIRLPFRFDGPFDVTLRYKRHMATPAEIRFFVGDTLAASRVVPQQDFELLEFHSENDAGGPFELQVLSQSDDPRRLSLALDWMQVRPARRLGTVLPSAAAMLWMLSWVLAFYLVPRVLGLGLRVATLSGAAGALALAVLASAHKLWPVHASMTLGGRTHVFVLLLLAWFAFRRHRKGSAFASIEARWAVYVVYVGFAVRLFALFHPDFYYPDVRTHSKFVSLIWTAGLEGFFADFIENQHRHLLGLQLVNGEWLAFPYPPLLYLTIYPMSLFQLPVEDWMKLVPTGLAAVEALILFALARRLGVGAKASLIAAGLHATARVVAFRLAVASYAALFGHFWDLLAVLYLVVFFDRMERPRYAAGFAALVAVSLLSYAGSALVLGMFVPAFCLSFLLVPKSARPRAWRVLTVAGWALAGALVAVLSFYWQYVPEILLRPDSGASHAGLIDLSATPLSALRMSAYRLDLFYGAFGFLALAALVFYRNTLRGSLAFPLVFAAVLTYIGLNVLRAGLGDTHIFQFTKDDLVILPVVVVALGKWLADWSERPRLRIAALAIALAWVGWGIYSFAGDIRSRFIRPDYPPASSRSADDLIPPRSLRPV